MAMRRVVFVDDNKTTAADQVFDEVLNFWTNFIYANEIAKWKCSRCLDTGHVCRTHNDRPWEGENAYGFRQRARVPGCPRGLTCTKLVITSRSSDKDTAVRSRLHNSGRSSPMILTEAICGQRKAARRI